MEWATILVQVLSAVGAFVLEAIKDGNLTAAIDKPLSEILGRELRSTIAKREADEAAARKFGAQP